jgi:hypothetical protein
MTEHAIVALPMFLHCFVALPVLAAAPVITDDGDEEAGNADKGH